MRHLPVVVTPLPNNAISTTQGALVIPTDPDEALVAVRSLLAQADEHHAADQVAEALQRYQAAWDQLQTLPMTPEYAGCDASLAAVLQRMGRYAEAAPRYRRLAQVNDLLDRPLRAVEYLERLATCMAGMGRGQEAVALRRQVRERVVAVQAWEHLSHVELFLGCDLTELGCWDEAAARFRSARRLAARHGCAGDVAWADLMLARALQELGQVARAEQHALLAVAGFSAAGEPVQAADALVALGAIRCDALRPEHAREAYERALPTFIASGDRQRASWTAEQVGLLLVGEDRSEEALAYFEVGADQAALGHLPSDEADCWDHAASCLHRLERFDQAEDYHHRALVIYERLRLDDDVAVCLANLAATLEELGRHDTALACLERARAHWSGRGEVLEVARLDLRLGVALDHTGRLEESLVALHRARRVYEQRHQQVDIAEVDLCLAWTLADLGASAEAVACAQAARPVLAEAGFSEAVRDCDELLALLGG